MDLAFIPSPPTGVVHLGPIPLRGYAFCIILGVVIGVWLGNKRWKERGGQAGTVMDIAVWAVPFGLVGGRLYHVITTYQPYFGAGGHPLDAFKVWNGGLGIWGAVALGAVGAWIGCRRRGIPLPAWADAVAPGLALAQAMGRWGNWFNQELYGKPTDVPWALKISSDPALGRVGGTYHPTFLYECLWCIGVALLVMWADRRFRLGHGRVFALYVACYCVGRGWIEYMRVDTANHILGLRLNDWTAMIVFLLAVAYMVLSSRRAPGREAVVEPAAEAARAEAAADRDDAPEDTAKDTAAKAGAPKDAPAPAGEAPKDAAAKDDGAAPDGTEPGDAGDASETPAEGEADRVTADASSGRQGKPASEAPPES